MKVYLDIVFLVNFGINFLFSYLVVLLFNEKVKFGRLFMASCVAGVFMVTMLSNIIIYNFFKVFGGLILTILGMGLNRFVLKCSLFYLLHFSLTGIVASFDINSFYLLVGIIVVLCLIILENIRRRSIIPNHLKYNISVNFMDEHLSLQGFLDTGNIVCHNNIPIVFISKKYYRKEMKVSEVVVAKTIDGITMINCFTPQVFVLYVGKRKIEKKVLVAFTALDEQIDCLLNYYLFY